MAGQSRQAPERVERAFESLDAADLAPIEPPPFVWDGIDASVESGRAELPGSATPETAVLVIAYSIDASDVLIEFGAGWVDSAIDHGAPELTQPGDQRVLWESIDDDGLRELWQLVVERVRSAQSEVHIPFRCDSARDRRWFDMIVEPATDGGVRFRSVLAFREEREPVEFLDPTIERDDTAEPIALCGWCGRGRLGDTWLSLVQLDADLRLSERPAPPPVATGICDSCKKQMSADLRDQGVDGVSPA